MVSSPEKIVEIFFSELSSELNKYDRNLKDVISDYSNELIKSIDASSFKLSSLFLESGTKNSLSEQYDKINATIKGISKRLVIYIDDVDRLDKNETIEVLRLIRNTANFGNVFFIVAFDRGYLIDSITTALGKNKETYIEKIFQLEYNLPVNADKQLVEKLTYKYLTERLSIEEKRGLLHFQDELEARNRFNEAYPLLNEYLKHIRDVKRYMNLFDLNFQHIKGYVYLPDYLNITILLLKFPSVYYEIYQDRYKYFEVPKNSSNSSDRQLFELKIVEDDANKPNKITAIKAEFGRRHEKYLLTEDSAELAIELLHDIFGKSNKAWSSSAIRSYPLNHLSIIYPAYFTRYFDSYIAGKLDQREFDSAIIDSSQTFLNFIDRIIASDENMKLQLKEALESHQSNNREEFETLVTGIFQYATHNSVRDTHHNLQISYNRLEDIIGGRKSNPNRIVQKFYGSNINEYKIFLWKQLEKFKGLDVTSFTYKFFKNLGWEYDDERKDSLTFPPKELKKWFLDHFTSIVITSTQLSRDIVFGLQEIVDYHKIHDDVKYTFRLFEDDLLVSIVNSLKTRLLKTDKELFVKNNIVKCHDFEDGGGIKLHQAFLQVIKSREELDNFLSDTSFTKEFIDDFISLYKSSKDESVFPCRPDESFPNLKAVRRK